MNIIVSGLIFLIFIFVPFYVLAHFIIKYW
jgi:hypothetical protein